MFRRSPAKLGDLQPIRAARDLAVARRNEDSLPWATTLISCLSALALFAAGAAWLNPHRRLVSPAPAQHAVPVYPIEAPSPATFPSWVEVPHLTGPLSYEDDLGALPPADGPRSFLDPNPADMAEQPAVLPPRANPRLPLIGRAPLDAARLTHELSPSWNEPTERTDVVISALPAVVTLGPDLSQPLQDQAGSKAMPTLPANPASTPILPPNPAQMPSPPEAVVRPTQPVTVSTPSRRAATLSSDPAQEVVDRTTVITPSRDAETVVAPIPSTGPAKHARSLRHRAVTTASRAREPRRDAEQTASFTSLPKPARTRIDAGAVAHASLHRARTVRPATSSNASAPSSTWTLPSALAPTD